MHGETVKSFESVFYGNGCVFFEHNPLSGQNILNGISNTGLVSVFNKKEKSVLN
jgi:site-specific DNA-adenine methylase